MSLMKEDLRELTKKNSDLTLNLEKLTSEKEMFSVKVNEILDSELCCSICSDLIYQVLFHYYYNHKIICNYLMNHHNYLMIYLAPTRTSFFHYVFFILLLVDNIHTAHIQFLIICVFL